MVERCFVYKNSLDFIHDNYEVEKRTFLGKTTQKDLYHLPIPQVLRSDYINERVLEATKEGVRTAQNFYKGVNIICAGLLAKKLFKLPYLDALTGHGFFFKRDNVKDYINTYRPYTHEKLMNWHDGVFGMAIVRRLNIAITLKRNYVILVKVKAVKTIRNKGL